MSVLIAYFSAPNPNRAKNAKDFGLSFDQLDMSVEPRQKPGEWFEYSPILIIIVGAILVYYLIDAFRTSPTGALAATRSEHLQPDFHHGRHAPALAAEEVS